MNTKTVMKLILALFLSLGLMMPAAESGLEIGVSANYGLFSADDYESGVGVFALLNYNLSKLFVLQIQGGMQTAGTLNDPKGFDRGSLSLFPMQFSLFFRVPIMRTMSFRLGAGAGYAFSSFKLDNQRNWDQIGFSVSQKLKAGPIFHGAAAFDILVSDKMTLFIEGRYCSGRFDGEYEIRDRVSSETANGSWKEDIDYLTISAGVSISLKKTPSVQRFVVPERKKN